MTDEELVALACAGDTAAFDQLVRRHQAAVYRAALAALRSPAEAEDAAQDAFVRAWTNLHRSVAAPASGHGCWRSRGTGR